MSVYNDIDKTLLARLASLGSAGLYGAAYRAVEMAFTPVSALLYSSYPRFFQHGARGLKACLQLSKSLMPVALAYTVAVGIILYFTAPLLGLVLGHEYHDGIPIMRGLAALPFLRAIQYFGANSLTGADRQGSRSLAQVAIALVNVGLNLAFIPTYGWRAAVWTTLLSEGLLAVVLWGIAGWYVAMERPAPPREADEAKGEVEGIGLLRGRA
jgi:O-antigen/teichoic acid export membrane protein